MNEDQNWRTEFYRGMDVHVTALPHAAVPGRWDFTVRVAQPGEDAAYESELTANAGDEADYASAEEAVEAGFTKGYKMVDALLQ